MEVGFLLVSLKLGVKGGGRPLDGNNISWSMHVEGTQLSEFSCRELPLPFALVLHQESCSLFNEWFVLPLDFLSTDHCISSCNASIFPSSWLISPDSSSLINYFLIVVVTSTFKPSTQTFVLPSFCTFCT